LDILDLENKRIILIQNLETWTSNRIKLFYLYDYFQTILGFNNYNFSEAFITEFIDKYIYLLLNTNPFYLHPKYFEQIINQADHLIKTKLFESYESQFLEAAKIFSNKIELLKKSLSGSFKIFDDQKIKFPLLETSEKKNILLSGFLETITTSVKKSKDKNSFIIVPSGANIETKLEKQISISWEIALTYSKKYAKRISDFHEVIIQFDQKAGNYSGNSLGTALTISFIGELLLLYNAEYLVKIKPGITITGGIDENQKIIEVSDDIVSKKTEILFYSTENTFVVPKKDELAAIKIYDKLSNEFPNRKLSIIGVDSLEDLFNRRNIIEITKQPYLIKTTKRIKKYWKALLVMIPLLILLTFLLYRDWDDNPALLESTENTLFVKNKSGRVLWTRKMGYGPDILLSKEYLSYFQKIVDINNDGINEVILANEDFAELKNNSEILRIVCFDKNKNEIWHYNFRDTISAVIGKMDTLYSLELIDTINIANNKVLLCIAKSAKSFSSAIFQLDLKTGNRVNSTLWNSGFFMSGIIKDFNDDGNEEIISTFINNGFEQVGVLRIRVDKLYGQCPTTLNYRYKNLPIADLEEYILFPKTDYTRYVNQRMEAIPSGSIHFENNKIYIGVVPEINKAAFAYVFDYKKNSFEIIIGNDFRVARDSLVVHGKLKPPLTDTDEYCNLLISQIKYWNGKEFVYRKD
jgi:hypothetical protein